MRTRLGQVPTLFYLFLFLIKTGAQCAWPAMSGNYNQSGAQCAPLQYLFI